MILNDSDTVKKNFNNRLDELVKLDEKENNIKITLIYSIFALAFLFICVSTFIVYRNYKIWNMQHVNEEEIINVKVIEREVNNG